MRGSAPHPVVKKGCFNMCFLAPPVAGATCLERKKMVNGES